MGSLERVQFKFASIIGELCSEPLLLSQFAVWLDMKLAEYKAKGSISLDCSGEKPEPPWMKGVLPPSPASLPTSLFEKTQSSHSTPKSRSPFLQSSRQPVFPSNQKPNSYDPEMVECPEEDDEYIVVKEEHEDSSLYLSQHHIDNTEQETADYIQSSSRKRLSNDGSNSGHLSKISRLAPTSSSPSTSSQSHIRASTETDLATSENILGSLGLTPSAELSERQNSWLGQVTAEKEDNSTGLNALDLSRSSQSPVCGQGATWWDSPSTEGNGVTTAAVSSEDGGRYEELLNQPGISTSTVRHTKAAVRLFERWMSGDIGDVRRIEDVPPAELDSHLAVFYSNIQKSSGEEYTPSSLKNLRSCLELYLKQKGYSASITKSPLFQSSQLAFLIKRRRLQQIKHLASIAANTEMM